MTLMFHVLKLVKSNKIASQSILQNLTPWNYDYNVSLGSLSQENRNQYCALDIEHKPAQHLLEQEYS
jgi:hypothetical protein